MTNSEVQSIFQEAISMCEAVGYKPQKLYPVCKINSRKKAYGVCKEQRDRYTGAVVSTEIGVSKYFVAKANKQQMLETLVHECLHSAVGGTCGHKGEWKLAANEMSIRYNLDIERTSDYRDEQGNKILANEQVAKYQLQCPKCGKIFYYNRLCKAVKNPQNFVHPGCNIGLIRTK